MEIAMETIEELKSRIKFLEQQLDKKNVPNRQKIEKMSSEVVDTNPYRYAENSL